MPRLTPEEEQRRSFAFGNCSIENPAVTREIVDEEAEKMPRLTPMELIDELYKQKFGTYRCNNPVCGNELCQLERELPDFLALVVRTAIEHYQSWERDMQGEFSEGYEISEGLEYIISRSEKLWRKQRE